MPGFDFSNYNRNAALHARGVPLPKATSTGTTIVGCIFDGGVVVSGKRCCFFCCGCSA
jgi:20S proteasome subunit beta 2